MEDIFKYKTIQLTEYKTLSNGESGCLMLVAPNTPVYGNFVLIEPTLFFMSAPWREADIIKEMP